MDNDLQFKLVKPQKSLADFVESFWLLHNRSDKDKEIVVLPDGRIDLTFSQSAAEAFHVTLSGIETHPEPAILKPQTLTCAISFKLPATEYILRSTVSSFLNYAAHLPAGFWNFSAADLQNFELFCDKASRHIHSLLPTDIDSRKLKLFSLIYASNGTLPVKTLSEQVYWSSRQINRYFNQQYGLSLKTYCSILRFRASLDYLAQGSLFPEPDFTDQSHYIKEIKRFSGVAPKELRKNKNDRFIQFSVLAPQ